MRKQFGLGKIEYGYGNMEIYRHLNMVNGITCVVRLQIA